MTEILKAFESDIESFTLVPSDGGRYELTVNGKLIYSKLRTGRHVEPGEVVNLVKKHMKEG